MLRAVVRMFASSLPVKYIRRDDAYLVLEALRESRQWWYYFHESRRSGRDDKRRAKEVMARLDKLIENFEKPVSSERY